MDSSLLLGLYSIGITLTCLFGSKLADALSKEHSKLQLALSFVSGILLGLALLHFLPTAIEELNSVQEAVYWMLAGLLTVFFLERFFCYHHHEESDCQTHAHSLNWSSTLIGLTVHSLLEGFALAAAVSSKHVMSLGVFLGILFHKPFDGFTLNVLLEKNKAKNSKLISILFALTVPLGALIYNLTISSGSSFFSVGAALAFSGGAFLCISLSDLLPELHFHNHDRFKLSFALLLGIAITVASAMLEFGHGHNH